ncbi:MAG: tRNA (guanosine(46)-N7)-methyltransferase TrmB [Saprospiraceae bacterium]|nr:tRNA (guanosine(46)-N7)-methyltransferase TrmB [Saprospiraceae bacterium]
MSKRSKLEKFAENLNLPNVFENFSFKNPVLYKTLHEQIEFKGNWKLGYFKNKDPLVLELACGGGEYCLGLSALYPINNYIGIDIKGARIWKGAKKALDTKNERIAFLRTKIELLPHFFSAHEVDEIWITFPDPFLKQRKTAKRLTAPFYLNIYKQILKPKGMLHLKTDDTTLYNFTLETLQQDTDFKILDFSDNIYNSGKEYPEMDVKTYYELKHLAIGKTIKYIRFQRTS